MKVNHSSLLAVIALLAWLIPATTASPVAAGTSSRAVLHSHWAVVLCSFSDKPTLPQGTATWKNLFSFGTGGVADFWRDETYGRLDVSNISVLGPYTIPDRSPVPDQITKEGPWFGDCAAKAKAIDAAALAHHHVIYYVNSSVKAGGFDGTVIKVDPDSLGVEVLAHEMGHVYGLNDSVSTAEGWYGDHWDVMSAEDVQSFDRGAFPELTNRVFGPGLNAGNLVALGYIPAARIDTLAPGRQKQTATVTLAALGAPNAPGPMVVRIPAPRGWIKGIPDCVTVVTGSGQNACSVTGNFYTVEFRQKGTGWDSGFAFPAAVFVHENGTTNHKHQSVLRAQPMTTAGRWWSDRNIKVQVVSFDSAHAQATVSITY
jgi:hypothetical protein